MLWVLLAITLLGALLLTLGLVGRVVGDSPHCRACRFDLAGLDLSWRDNPDVEQPEHAVCPDCDAPLNQSGSLRHGLRRRSWKLTAIGILFLLPIAIVVVFRSQGMPWTTWNATKPAWVLELDARLGSPITKAEAVNELNSRIRMGTLSEGMKGRLVALAEQRLGQGADGSLEWYDLVIDRRVPGEISEESWDRINQRMVRVGQGLFEEMDYRISAWQYNTPRRNDFGYEGFTQPSFDRFQEPIGLLFALESVEVEGYPIALVNRSAIEREKGLRPQGVSEIEAIEEEIYTFVQIQNGPDWKEVVQDRSHWPGHVLSEGAVLNDLAPGEHDATATWRAYIVVGTLGDGPYNTLPNPAFGPFEVTKEYIYRVK